MKYQTQALKKLSAQLPSSWTEPRGEIWINSSGQGLDLPQIDLGLGMEPQHWFNLVRLMVGQDRKCAHLTSGHDPAVLAERAPLMAMASSFRRIDLQKIVEGSGLEPNLLNAAAIYSTGFSAAEMPAIEGWTAELGEHLMGRRPSHKLEIDRPITIDDIRKTFSGAMAWDISWPLLPFLTRRREDLRYQVYEKVGMEAAIWRRSAEEGRPRSKSDIVSRWHSWAKHPAIMDIHADAELEGLSAIFEEAARSKASCGMISRRIGGPKTRAWAFWGPWNIAGEPEMRMLLLNHIDPEGHRHMWAELGRLA